MAEPSDHYQQHHEVSAPRVDLRVFRQGWRVRTRLDALRADGSITADQWQAAIEYRDAWTRVLADGGGDPGTMRIGRGSNDPHARLWGHLETLSRLRMTETRIGSLATWLCRRCLVEDAPWREIGRQLHRDHKTARDWTIEAVRALALAWAAQRRGGLDASPERKTPRRPPAAS
jgi:hypothetical protein